MKNQNTAVIWKIGLLSSPRIKVRPCSELGVPSFDLSSHRSYPPPFSASPLFQPHRRSLPFTFDPDDGSQSRGSLDMPASSIYMTHSPAFHRPFAKSPVHVNRILSYFLMYLAYST